jgi:hypothetical protein
MPSVTVTQRFYGFMLHYLHTYHTDRALMHSALARTYLVSSIDLATDAVFLLLIGHYIPLPVLVDLETQERCIRTALRLNPHLLGVRVCVCVCVCVTERERERERERENVGERERVYVYMCVRGRERESVCVCERERERERKREKECVCCARMCFRDKVLRC